LNKTSWEGQSEHTKRGAHAPEPFYKTPGPSEWQEIRARKETPEHRVLPLPHEWWLVDGRPPTEGIDPVVLEWRAKMLTYVWPDYIPKPRTRTLYQEEIRRATLAAYYGYWYPGAGPEGVTQEESDEALKVWSKSCYYKNRAKYGSPFPRPYDPLVPGRIILERDVTYETCIPRRW